LGALRVVGPPRHRVSIAFESPDALVIRGDSLTLVVPLGFVA
jgi:hypothetical protein